MSDTDPSGLGIETARAEPASRRLSAVWLVPLLALAVALVVAWRTYGERGPLIEILFADAAGIEEGQTTVRFRNVNVGLVERLGFTPDLKQVMTYVRIDKDVADFLDEDAQFWVVRPSVSAQGVTGIETVISGVYIEAYWDDAIGTPMTRFEGLPRPPLTAADQPGLRIRLRAPDGGSVSVGAPLLFKRIEVGRIENIELTDAGDVMIDAYVNAPHHLRLTEATRFWNASGFSIQLGAGGASLNVESLLSLLQGGVAFDTVGSEVTPVKAGHTFELYASESAARQNLFEDEPGQRLMLDVLFDGSVRGLEPGAAVEYRGIRIGQVTAIQAAVVQEENRPQVTLRATLSIVPARLGVEEAAGVDAVAAALDVLRAAVDDGLRARLDSTGLLAQTLFVDLVNLPKSEPATLEVDAEPYPLLPSAPAATSGIAASAQGVLERVKNLPLEQIVDSVATLLANANALLTDDRIRAAPENLGLLLADLRTLVGSSEVQKAPAEVAAVLASIRKLVEQATEEQLVASLGATVEDARGAIARIETAADGVPDLVTEVQTFLARLRDLPLDDLVAAGTRLVDDLDAFVQSDAVAAVPGELQAAIGDMRRILADLRNGGAVANVNATLASVRSVADELATAKLVESIDTAVQEARTAAGNVSAASSDLPELVDSLTRLSGRASALPLEDLVASAAGVLDTADGFLASEGVESVPPRLSAALEEVRAVLAELRAGGAVASVNTTLASADEAAQAVTAAAKDLPALVARLSATAEQAEAAIATVGPSSEINRDTLLLLREVRDAARAVNSLVSALERRPNSVVFGR